ncbi:MAG: type II secretion system F family protein [Lachnospiraceae bacterium]|nr:type II secretion system F family protein [Lachnospiraceae bacterium]
MKKRRIGKYKYISAVPVLLSTVFIGKKIASAGFDAFFLKDLKNLIPILFFFFGIGLFFFGDRLEERENRKKREEELKESFPEFALKISMLIRAGFTPKGAFEKVGRNYLRKREREKSRREILYEEVVISLREMESGVSQKDAYEHFEMRCNVFEITRFCGLLIRAVKRGNTSLGEELREESRRAVAAKQEQVRKRGETAGTKLLFPMMLFLLIVMIIILYPAFSSLTSL